MVFAAALRFPGCSRSSACATHRIPGVLPLAVALAAVTAVTKVATGLVDSDKGRGAALAVAGSLAAKPVDARRTHDRKPTSSGRQAVAGA